MKCSLTRLALSTAALVFMFFAVACGSDSPTTSDGQNQETPTVIDVSHSTTGRTEYSGGVTIYAATFGSSGGTLDGPDADFMLSEDAVSISTTITMTVDDATPNQVTMGPSGSFAETCLLLMEKPSGYPTGTVFEIYWWDAANSEWVDLDAGDLGPVLSVQIDHFSTFKISVVSS